MSADNGIYILELKYGEYVVKDTSAIENLYYNPETHVEEDELVMSQVKAYFKDGHLCSSFNEAVKYARDYAEEHKTEYGIRFINMQRYSYSDIFVNK